MVRSVQRVRHLLWLVGVALLVGCTSGPPAPDDSAYVDELLKERTVKDEEWRKNDDPIAPAKRATLLPLRYFAPDPSYVVSAELKLSDTRPTVELPTSTGTRRRFDIVGTLEFNLHGEQLSLGALSPSGEPIRELFVPFADQTTGKETYKAGRYLDLPPTATGLYTIDFNRAYNPTCAYNDAYECPYPPPSNRLKVAIRAGEKAPGA